MACLQLQTAISDCYDAAERRDLFVAKRHINQEKSNEIRFLTNISDFKQYIIVCTLYFLCLLRSGLFLHPHSCWFYEEMSLLVEEVELFLQLNV